MSICKHKGQGCGKEHKCDGSPATVEKCNLKPYMVFLDKFWEEKYGSK